MAETARFFLPRDVEIQLLDEADTIRAEASAYQDQATPQLAQRVSQLSRTYPGARPGVLMSAAQAGLGDDEVEELVAKDYEAQSQDTGWMDSIFDVASDLANTAGRFLGGAVDFAANQGLKPLARTVTTVGEGLFDEIVQRPMIAASQAEGNLLTNPGAFGKAWRETGDSVLGQSVQAIARGERPDLGTGYFAGGGIREEAHTNDLNMQIGGKSANTGRVLTKSTISNLPVVGEYVKPGTKAFDVVAGVAQLGTELFLDPFSKAAKAGQAMRKASRAFDPDAARKLLQQFGAVANGPNSTVLIERAEKLLGDKGVIRKLTETTDFDEIWKGSKKNLTPDQALRLMDSTDDVTTASILLEEVAHGAVKEKGFYSGFGEIRKARDRVRLTKQMPGHDIDLSDSRTAVDQLDSLMATVKLDSATKSRHNAALARALRDGGELESIEEVMRGVHHDMAVKFHDDFGIDPEAVKELVEFKKGFTTENRIYLHDEIGDPLYFPGSKITTDAAGVERAAPTAHALSEYNENMYALPDARELRKAAQKWSVLRKVYNSKGWDTTTAKADRAMQVWKQFAYVRPAYLFRVPLGEEQGRIWADSDNMLRSPGALMRALIRNPKKSKDLLGDDLADVESFKHAMANGATEKLFDRKHRRAAARGWTTTGRGDVRFTRGWKTELNQAASDPVHRGILEADDPYEWFWSGGGRQFREQLARGTNSLKKGYVSDDVAKTVKKQLNSDETFTSAREMADAYVDTIRARIDAVAGGGNGRAAHPDLVDAIRRGDVEDLKLDDYLDSAPQKVKVPVDETLWDEVDNTWFDRVFESIVIDPTNRVARGPAYDGYLGKAYADLMDAATPQLRQQVIANAKKRGLDKAVIREMEKKASKLGNKSGLLDDINDLNEMAHYRASDQVKGLLYDMTRKGNFADATRLIFPFAEAWVEMMTTWGKLTLKSTAGARALHKSRVVMDNGESMGFFDTNDFGDKVFNYPGGGKLYEFANGGAARVQAQGRLAGMNMIATGVGPGFGPLVQWPVSALASSSPDLEWFKDAVAPFGSDLQSPSDLLDPGKVINEAAPAWAKKVLNGISNGKFGREEDIHRTIGDVATILAESGNYEPGDPRLMQDAGRHGKFLHVIRGFAQSILPTGPELSYEFQDPSGRWLTMRNLSQAWRDIRNEAADDVEATSIFNQRYGLDPWFVSASKSQTINFRPTDEVGDNWMRRNPQAVENFPLVAGYFAPSGGDFSFDAWRRNFATGDSVAYTPEQRIAIAEKQKAWMIYNRQQQLAEGMAPADKSRYLADVKMDLEEDFPGWMDKEPGVRETASRDQKIAELRLAAKDPVLGKTEAGKALSIFFERFDQAERIRDQRDPTARAFGEKRDADLIQYLNEVGRDLAADMPEFHGMWTYIFEPEFN